MAITLQTVLPQKVLPRAPSPNASSPNPGVRSSVTQFIPASPDLSLDQDALLTPNGNSIPNGSSTASSSTQHTQAPPDSSRDFSDAGSNSRTGALALVGRKSMSAGAGSRRGIAHSTRVLGVDKKAKEAIALSKLTNGKVDVSFEASLGMQPLATPTNAKAKGKARDGDQGKVDQVALFDVDLESAQPMSRSGSSNSSRTGRLLQLGAQSLPWNKSKTNLKTPAYEEADQDVASSSANPANTSLTPATKGDASLDFPRPTSRVDADKADYGGTVDAEEELGAFDDDREQLLYAGAAGDERPGHFAPGDRSFAYNSLQGSVGVGGYGGRIGFESVTWREGGWMMFSAVLVGVLITVAILISIDVIDWPGDGIGNN